MMKKSLICIACCLLLSSCVAGRQASLIHTAPARDGSNRQAGPAMDLYQQAEKDMDVNNVIVIPPPVSGASGSDRT